MSSFAALIDVLSISGSRLSDGSANASGRVWFFEPGGNTPVSVYSDAAASAIVTAPVTLTNGGLLNRTDYPDGIFATQPIRLYIENVSGTVVSDTVWIPATAGDVGVDNAGFTDSTLDDVLTKALASFGGTDWTYKESTGATSRTVKAKFQENSVSVKDFGAVGDGVAIDTTAVQAAVSRVKALGGGVVYFPPGTYRIDQAIVLSSGTGVRFVGAGMGATTVKSSHATANIFSLSSCTACEFHGINTKNAGTSTGAAFSLSSCTDTVLTYCGAEALTASGTYRYGINLSASSRTTVNGCVLYAGDAANGRGILVASSSALTVTGGVLSSGAAGYAIEFTGTSGTFTSINSVHGTAIRFALGATGSLFTFIGGTYNSGGNALSIATATFRDIRMFGTGVDGYTEDVLSGGTFTPDISLGRYIRVRATSTGAAITIAAPTPPPTTSTYGLTIILDVFNNAGGALSNAYTMNAAYKLATVPNQTDLNHNVYTLAWDPNSSVWRQVSLSVTT